MAGRRNLAGAARDAAALRAELAHGTRYDEAQMRAVSAKMLRGVRAHRSPWDAEIEAGQRGEVPRDGSLDGGRVAAAADELTMLHALGDDALGWSFGGFLTGAEHAVQTVANDMWRAGQAAALAVAAQPRAFPTSLAPRGTTRTAGWTMSAPPVGSHTSVALAESERARVAREAAAAADAAAQAAPAASSFLSPMALLGLAAIVGVALLMSGQDRQVG